MQSNSQSGPDNERLFELLAGADSNYRDLLIHMIGAQATPEMLHKAIESWQILQSSISEGRNRLRGRAVAGAAVAAAMIPRGDGAWVPQSYTSAEVEAFKKYWQEMKDNEGIVSRSSADDS